MKISTPKKQIRNNYFILGCQHTRLNGYYTSLVNKKIAIVAEAVLKAVLLFLGSPYQENNIYFQREADEMSGVINIDFLSKSLKFP